MFSLILVAVLARQALAQLEFTVANGQIFTPGPVILNAPQPGTPLGGEALHVSIDVTANGRLPLPPYREDDGDTRLHSVTMFLYSYDTGRNFTVSNGTDGGGGDTSMGDIMSQEEGSTVKHIHWVWPDCLVGDGQPQDVFSDRGTYNISIRQNYQLKGENYYTIFDVPISVTNRIDAMDERPSCDDFLNPMLTPEMVNVEGAKGPGTLFAPPDATVLESSTAGDDNASFEGVDLEGNIGDGDGPQLEDGLGGAGILSPMCAPQWICLMAVLAAFLG